MAKAKFNKKFTSVGVEMPECPVCLETMSAPIFQCQSGHSLCSSCTKSLIPPICPICRQAMTQIRNWQLEDIISKASVPCPNKSAGCVYIMSNMEVENHLKECIFRQIPCPHGNIFGKCFWSGTFNAMLDHFKERHPANCFLNDDIEIDIKNVSVTVDDRHMYLVAQNKFLFIVSFKVDTSQKMAYWAVQHIGGKKLAEQHVYEINVTSKQDPRRKVTFADHCVSDAMDVNQVFYHARCGVMPLILLSQFIMNGTVTFSFKVQKAPHFKKGPGPNPEQPGNQNKGPGPKNAGPHPKGPGKRGGHNNRGKSPAPHAHRGQQKQNNQ